ncbi:proteasome stabiliser-domain-containing protein [Plectosphaerella cucumerina]|uniref:Proteasome stabiliser-domain-containing protein n=1 Tax=Plectosphaerella cucumerina TaxID=40658 RepID=A0A8K0X8W4_9PEZI|nr:proteasome stabiliser-domain-containing protein [Plectosphaerella cucumerina]
MASSEENELRLIQNAQFKILGVSNNEKKFEDILKIYLCPLMLKAGSQSASVIKFAGSLQTMLKPTKISLPVEALVDQYKSQSSPIIRKLDAIFITIGLERMDDYERQKVAHKIFSGISAVDQGGSSSAILKIALRIIPSIKVPSRGSKEDSEFRDAIGLAGPGDAAWLAVWLGNVLLLKLPALASGSQPSPADFQAQLKRFNGPLTAEELSYLGPEWRGNKYAPPFDELPVLRRKVVHFLQSAAFNDREKLVPAIFGASSTDGVVSSVGEDMLKRTSVSLDDEELAKDLFSAHSRMTPPYRTRILGLLSKSTTSTSMESAIQHVVNLDFGLDCPEPLQAKSGLEKQKLQRALLGYLSFVATWGPTKGPFTIGNSLIARMQQHIEAAGWPVPDPEKAGRESAVAAEGELRCLAYDVLGLLAKATKLPIQEAMSLAGWLFRSLSEDPTPEVVFHIEGALSSLLKHFSPELVGEFRPLAMLLHNYMNLEVEPPAVRSARFTAVKWANHSFAFSEWRARWLDILAVAGRRDESHEVIEEGKKGLDPWTYRVTEATEIPDWTELIPSLFYENLDSHFDLKFTDPQTSGAPQIDTEDTERSFQNFQGGKLAAFPVALNFTKTMMYRRALPDFEMGPDWSLQMQTALKNEIKTRAKATSYLRDVDSAYVGLLLKTCFDGAMARAARKSEPLVEDSLENLTEIASLSPASSVGYIASQAPKLYHWSSSNNKQIRTLAARALGILGAHPANHDELKSAIQGGNESTEASFHSLIQQMSSRIAQWETAVGSEANAVEGDILAYGHLFSHTVYYNQAIEPHFTLPAGLLHDQGVSSSRQDAAFDAFAQLWTAQVASAIPKPGTDFSPEFVIEKLKARATAGNEKAIFALGRLALALPDTASSASDSSKDGLLSPDNKDDQIDNVLRVLYELGQKRETEIHFAIGEAIAAAVARLDSEAVQLTVNVDATRGPWADAMAARPYRVKLVLDKLFKDCKDTSPWKLKSSGIWLFCLIQYCGTLPEVRARLREAQVAFMRLLSARDELVQETASRGLVLIFEKGDKDLREVLVKDLVSSFTDQSAKLKVEGDTELFEAGALPTGDGKSVTSYKDIVALANEVGDQSLVYKFMALANNAATWSTRAAFGRFGLGDILADSHIDPKVYPKLFRYRFDPNPNAQRSMENVWKALVKDPNAVIQEHFDDIMLDLLKTVLGKEWRSREASCAAISELIGGQPFEKYAKYYEEIWTAALKVLDDVKTSVRNAALKLCMGLTNTIVRLLEDGGNSAAAQSMLKDAFRFLLSPSGLESNVKEVQAFSLQSIMDITKKGGKVLKPFISTIVPHLLNLHSTIEPEQLNYAYQKVAEDTRGQIDKMRATWIRNSPITEAVNNCLRQLDADSMKRLAPGIEATMKSAIGMQTKIACGGLLGDLVIRHRIDFEPYAAKFLKMMAKEALDRNDEVSRSYAVASAYIIRVASSTAKQSFVDKFIQMYIAAEDDTRRRRVSDVFLALSKSSPDEFNNLETRLLPFVYVASHDTEEYVKKAFSTIWDSHAGSSRTVARYVDEIAKTIQLVLEAPRWALQHTGAFTLAAMIPALVSASDKNGQLSEANLKQLWPILDKVLALKTFEGKEKVLESFPIFVEKGTALWKADATVAAQMKKIALREAKRNNEAYRIHALKYVWKFAKAREDLDLLDEIFAIAEPFLENLVDESRMEIDSEDKAADTAKSALEAVARGYGRGKLQEQPLAVLEQILDKLKPYLSSQAFALIKRQVWYECVRDLMREAKPVPSQSDQGKAVAMTYLMSLDMDHVDVGTESQRSMRAQAIGAVLKAKTLGVFGSPPEGMEKEDLMTMVRNAMEMERSADIRGQLKGILEEMES